MNWLSISLPALLGMLIGLALGAIAFAYALHLDFDAPYLVGISAGLGTAVASKERATMRGLVAAVLSLWVVAITQSLIGRYAGTPVLALSRTLSGWRDIKIVACMGLGGGIGMQSLHRGAKHRRAGS
jgi:uncharacterized membrane protein YwaF